MHLKRMELFGFKSFAEKSELSLSPGIAAVIGPNGCGKSNLVDAVRWALGEQSVKSLRGTKMEEIIFSGSDSRKPLNFAEVSLTFSGAAEFLNLDYDEITITRRLFRNGDSEYYINKSPCRLKDITELFLDTGLGKDVYSVIGQGRVDEIINSRPEERREIFEEAAGIFKYKLRKKEARRRLDETRENLIRVQDLVYELETQIEPLQEQAEITRQYRNLQHQIVGEEKKLLSFQLHQSREQLDKVNRQLQSVNDALLNSAAQGGLQEKELHDLKNNLHDQQAARKAEEQKLNELVRHYEQQENEQKLLVEREKHFKDQLEQSRLRIQQLENTMDELAARRVKAEADLILKNEELSVLEHQLQELRAKLEKHGQSALSAEIERLQENIYKAGARKEAASVAIIELSRRLERIEQQKNICRSEEKTYGENMIQSGENVQSLEKHINEVRTSFSENENLLRELSSSEEHLRKELENALAKEQQLRENLQGVAGRLSLLKEQDSALSGYYRGVREIVQAGSSLPGIIGPVADLISVEGEYIQAVESALGPSLQYIVAESEKSVQATINYLKEQNRGWATFLPLDILHDPANPLDRYPGWRDLKGVVGRASELVKVDPASKKAIEYLLSPILVCRTLEDASGAARFVKHSCRIVTLEGEMINPGGIMRGGSLPKRSANMPLGRRREIEELQKKESGLKEEYNKAARTVADLKGKFEQAVKAVRDAEDENRKITDQISEISREIERCKLEGSNIQARIDAERETLAELETEEKEIISRQADLKTEITTSEEEIKNLEQKLSDLKEGYQHFIGEKNLLEQKITDLLVRISSIREQSDGLTARIEEITESMKKPAEEKIAKNLEREKYQKNIDENREAQKKIAAKLEELNSDKADMIIALEKKTGAENRLEAELIEMEEKERLRQSRLSRQEKRERQLSVEQTRLQTEVNYQEMRFREQFRNLELLLIDESFEPESCRIQVETLKEDLESLGEVNLGAIEELTRLEDRINFLNEQKEDLQKGEASLNKVLAEIDQRMEYYFTKAFDQINENFGTTFKELFQGGQVLLKLTDGENILESGIEIVAQPPGKKLQNITLLSAGEKVLTAIALVFAILRFKPAPFYLLDEVESMLDDANLTRFTKFLKQNSEQAQFILITHRKRTMEEASVLYGVTMPEAGVSRLMSLKLEDNNIIRESQ
ncbi:MAG: chromosome segregation protein SMC [Firmicutes bacterium]|nr:chromosome segregation protein SMC [Bacillota bacterium]